MSRMAAKALKGNGKDGVSATAKCNNSGPESWCIHEIRYLKPLMRSTKTTNPVLCGGLRIL